MKKIILLLAAVNLMSFAYAQDDMSRAQDDFHSDKPADTSKCCCVSDMDLGPWAIDVNLLGGVMNQSLSSKSMVYANAVNSNMSSLKFSNGMSYGFDAQIGYFFGTKKHVGVGIGLMYLQQSGNLGMDNFHTEYQAADFNGNTYRQLLTANNGIKEKIKISNFNIPLVFKYKTQFGGGWGFAADAGLLFNVQAKNSYKSNASFDYEAIYGFSEGNNTYYDNSATPNPNDWLITKAYQQAHNPAENVNTYFQQKATQGYNVGLGVKPGSNSGSVKYTTGSVGFILQPSVTYLIRKDIALNAGLYYIYQNFKHNADNAYEITNKVGSYNSMLKSESSAANTTYGLNIGVRYFFGMLPDRDHDGTPDKNDRCPDVAGPKKLHGCPDRDNDGVADIDDECPDVPGLAKFNGCPDTDGDGIPDNLDECPTVPGLAQFNGCPDTDGDGIPDKDDSCPTVAGLPEFHGCPDTDGDGVPDNIDQCPTVPGPKSNHGCPYPPKKEKVSAPAPELDKEVIRFETGKAIIKKSTYAYIDEMVKELKNNKNADVEIDGHTDITGDDEINNKLSNERANAVKSFLIKRGIPAHRIKTKWYGSKHPVATNKTAKGRAKNRRAVLKLKYSTKYSDNDPSDTDNPAEATDDDDAATSGTTTTTTTDKQ